MEPKYFKKDLGGIQVNLTFVSLYSNFQPK